MVAGSREGPPWRVLKAKATRARGDPARKEDVVARVCLRDLRALLGREQRVEVPGGQRVPGLKGDLAVGWGEGNPCGASTPAGGMTEGYQPQQ